VWKNKMLRRQNMTDRPMKKALLKKVVLLYQRKFLFQIKNSYGGQKFF